ARSARTERPYCPNEQRMHTPQTKGGVQASAPAPPERCPPPSVGRIPPHGRPSVHPFDIGTQRVEAGVDMLITAVNLFHVLYHAASLGTQGGDEQRNAGPNVGRGHHRTAQAAFVVVADDRGAVRVAEDNLRPHVDELVHEEKTALEHL